MYQPIDTTLAAPATINGRAFDRGTAVRFVTEGTDALVRVVMPDGSKGPGARMPLALANVCLAALVVSTPAVSVDDLLGAGLAPSRIAEEPVAAKVRVRRPGHGDVAGVSRPATELNYRSTDSFVTEGDVAACRTAKELCDVAGLGWSVSRRKVSVEGDATGTADYVSIVRDDTNAVLTVRSKGFEVQQPHEAFAPLESLVAAGATFRGAGSFRGGKTIWAQVDLGAFDVVPGDTVKMFAHVRDTFDGARAWSLQVGSIRVVCANTLMHACDEGEMLAKSGHNANLRETVDGAAEALAALQGAAAKRVGEYRKLAAWRIGRDEVKALLDATLPRPEHADEKARDAAWKTLCDDVMTLMSTKGKGIEIEGVMGTAWGALNGVSEWTDHVLAGARKADLVTMEQRIHEGNAASVKERAYEWLVAHMPAASA